MTVKTEKNEEEEPAQPWGRFTLVSKDPVEERDHIDFSNKVTTIGRNKRHCDIVVNQPFISSVVRQPSSLHFGTAGIYIKWEKLTSDGDKMVLIGLDSIAS
ncbi:unnamed protein product [Phytophthora lilii]|uniref:Unnamed protein product n=1 Tax=Phytophthora lilii TaxID=2077276 RepID=A0A9W6TC62_9STRA|nr:unnamed protein product [Phytophthora lilii]